MKYTSETFGVAADGTPLTWIVVTPTGVKPWPVAIFAHIGGFRGGTPDEKALLTTAYDFAAAGFLCLSVNYRMDLSHVPGQTSNVYWPYQTDDIKQAVLSARLDPRCNGKVIAVGGSAGGTHALSAACETGSTDIGPIWTGTNRVLGSVCLSPPTQFDDRTPYGALQHFVDQLSRYCNTSDLTQQHNMSPTAFMDNTCKPLFIVASESDPMPPAQFNAVVARIAALGLTGCQNRFLPGSKHAFANWSAVKTDALAWSLALVA